MTLNNCDDNNTTKNLVDITTVLLKIIDKNKYK